MDPLDLANNIESTIIRTRQIMQESKAITIKNQQRKNMLEEKFSFNDLKIDRETGNSEPSERVRRVSEIEIRTTQDSPCKSAEEIFKIEELQSEIFELNKKVKNQATKIDLLEEKLNEVNLEKMKLLQELKVIKKEHESEMNRMNLKLRENERAAGDGQSIEERIRFLEEKYKEQVMANHELTEEIQKMQKSEKVQSPNRKITELEDLLLNSMKKYKGLKDRLEKTENLIALEKSSYLTPKSATSKKLKLTSPKHSGKKPFSKNKLSSYKSTTNKLS